MMKSRQTLRVERAKLRLCMTCPVCNRLLDDATTVSECLHTFCRKCIYEKITDEEVDSCPVCNKHLGCAPLEKLRADHSLQDLRAKIFPFPRTNATIDEVVPQTPLPARRKERSLSSLVVMTPKVSSETVLTGKKTKSASRKVTNFFAIDDSVNTLKEHPQTSSSPETLSKFTQNRIHIQSIPTEGVDALEGKADLWKPLNCLVEEVANKTKCSKSNSPGSVSKSSPSITHGHDSHLQKPKVRARSLKRKAQCEENGSPLPGFKTRKSKGNRQKKSYAPEGLNITPQSVIDAGGTKCERSVTPIWFSLLASEYQHGDLAPLPQISSRFLRIMDGNIPISSIKKYIAKKLGLESETEIEITIQGQPLVSTMLLQSLVDWWWHAIAKPQRVQTRIGTPAKDFVMVLFYSRKPCPHNP